MRTCIAGFALLGLASTAAAQSISTAPKDVIGPWTLTAPMVMCTDLPVTAKPTSPLSIFGIHSTEERHAASDGTLVIKRFAGDGLAIGQKFMTGRLTNSTVRFPKPGEGFGDIRVSGVVTINAIDDLNAMAEISLLCDAIEPGDFLAPYTETVLPQTAAPMDAPDFSERAHLLFGNDNRVAFGFGDTLSIDRGTTHGVVPGARYAIYRDKRNGMPLIYVGEIVVMATSEQTSKVVVTKANGAVETGDVAVPRRKAN